jgi:hypothetical protein
MWAPNTWGITKGNEAKIVVHVLDQNGDPINISGATAISLCVKKVDGTSIEKAAETGWTYGEPMEVIFIYGFLLTAEETDLLPLAEKQNVMVKITFGAIVKKYLIPKALSVRNVTL